MAIYEASELIINPDGSSFHLGLRPGQAADTILLVGDTARVNMIGAFLREVEYHASNREFTSLSGFFGNTRITALSTGIGPDNTDIVVNELDALVNIDFETRRDKSEKKSLRLIRIGTSGAIQPDIPVGARLASAWSIGLDGLMNYYRRPEDPERDRLVEELANSGVWPDSLPRPYASRPAEAYKPLFSNGCTWGITVSAHGFYGPQGRGLRAEIRYPELNKHLAGFRYQGYPVTNFEMESSALYGLAEMLGHSALTICLIIANRATKEFHQDYKPDMINLISYVLQTITD